MDFPAPPSRRPHRWRRRGLVALLLLTLGLAPFALGHLPPVERRLRAWAEARLTEAVGREVRIASLRLRLWQGRVDLHGVRIAGGPSPADGPLLDAVLLEARWSWTAALHRRLDLRELRLVRPRLGLPPGGGPGSGAGGLYAAALGLGDARAAHPRLRRLEIEGGEVAWSDAAGQPWAALGLQASLEWANPDAAGPPVSGRLRLARLRIPRHGAATVIERIALRVEATATELRVAAAEGDLAGVHLTAAGRLHLTGEAPRLDLALQAAGPLSALLRPPAPPRPPEGALRLEGRLQGLWNRPTFAGTAEVGLGATPRPDQTHRFALHWTGTRLEVESWEAAAAAPFSLRLVLEPESGDYTLRASAAGLDLARLTGLPAALAGLAGLEVPQDLAGRLTAEVSAVGRGADLGTLRGRGTLVVEGLAAGPDLPAGRLEARAIATAAALSLESFALKVAGAEVTGRGTLRFDTGRLELPIRISLPDAGALGRLAGLPSLGGQVALAGRITGTREAPRFQGSLLWRQARVALVGLDRVEGDIDVSARSLRTSRLRLQIGQTGATLKGVATARGTAPWRRLDVRRDLVLALTGQINPGRTADLAPYLPAGLAVRGPFRLTGRFNGTLEAPTAEAEIALTTFEAWGERWQRGEATLRVTPKGVEIQPLALRRGSEEVTGRVRLAGGALQGELATTPLDLARVGLLADSQLSGRARTRLTLQGPPGALRIQGEAATEGLVFRGVPLGPATATYTARGGALELRLTVQEGATQAEIRLGPPPDRALAVELVLTEADLLPLLRLGEIEAAALTRLRGSGTVRLRAPARDPSASEGEARLDPLRLEAGGVAWESREPVQLEWRGKAVTVRQARLRASGQEVDILGNVDTNGDADLAVTGRVPFAALAALLGPVRPAAGVVTADIRVRGPLRTPAIVGTAALAGGRFSLDPLAAPITDAQAAVDLDGPRLRLRSFAGRCAEGTLTGEGEMTRQGDGWRLRIAFQEEAGRVEQLLASRTDGTRAVSGALSLGGSLEGQGRSGPELLRGLGGQLQLQLRDGQLGKNTLFAQIFALLNLQRLFASPVADQVGGGMPYQRLRADLRIEGGVARTENLVLETHAAAVTAAGRLDLTDEALDLDVAVKPFQTIDAVLKWIPIAGWLLGGKDKGLIVAYYKVTGTLADPRMTALPLSSLGRNVFGVFRRLLDIPEALGDAIRNTPPQPPQPDVQPPGHR